MPLISFYGLGKQRFSYFLGARERDHLDEMGKEWFT